jgi:hypothetical protein
MNTRWQHKVVEVPVKIFGGKTTQRAQEELDKQSAQGWQLVAVTQASSAEAIRLYLKRPA